MSAAIREGPSSYYLNLVKQTNSPTITSPQKHINRYQCRINRNEHSLNMGETICARQLKGPPHMHAIPQGGSLSPTCLTLWNNRAINFPSPLCAPDSECTKGPARDCIKPTESVATRIPKGTQRTSLVTYLLTNIVPSSNRRSSCNLPPLRNIQIHIITLNLPPQSPPRHALTPHQPTTQRRIRRDAYGRIYGFLSVISTKARQNNKARKEVETASVM